MKPSKGFTLIELIIAMGVLTFAMALIIYAFTQSMRIFTAELYEGDTAVEIQRSIDRMTKELRNSLEIVSADGSSITFWSEDLNSNGTREANETVTYSWTGTSEGYLKRIVQTASIEVASGVKSFSLTYNNPAPSNIRLINIYMTVQKGSNLSTLESSVKSRNL
jgi:prepilin-type N-terminal cleavage/methylation domain-containing protein